MKQPKVSVIILNWNTKHFLEKFLPSVVQTNYQNLEIIVADNGSTDGSVEFIRDNFKNVKLIAFEKTTVSAVVIIEQLNLPTGIILSCSTRI